MVMVNKSNKIIAGVFFSIFVLIEFLLIIAGEAIMMGHRVFDDVVRIYAGLMIAISAFSMLLIFKDKTVGYLILALPITLTTIVYLGHRMLWWPCEYCNL